MKRLEIFGFKSFADKVDIDFGEGITAIVGPNGCGKSNIVDAIRWVLGEQRPRFLRGSRMEEVIFNGSERRDPLGMAEVTLTLDNSEGLLPIEYEEVTITRRLFRSGESEYLINRTPCRLMDLETLLMDTGIGPHSYSVMEQGMVEAILSEDPEDRRRLFEEAAGITKYKARRKAALQKLEAVERDLVRIGDIISEVERQVEALERQVRKAERYKAYRSQVREIELKLASHRYGLLEREARPLLEEEEALKDTVSSLAARLRKGEGEVERLRAELMEVEGELGRLGENIREMERKSHGLKEELAVLSERIRAAELASARADEELKGTERRLSEVGEELEGIRGRISELEGERRRLSAARDELRREVEDLEERCRRRRKRIEELRGEEAAIVEFLFRKGGEIERKESRRDGIRVRLGELQEERAQLEERLKKTRRRMGEVEVRIRQVKGKLEERRKEREVLSSQVSSKDGELRDLNRRSDEIEAQLSSLREQLEFWRRTRAQYEGYSDAVRVLLLESPLKGKAVGVLGDLVDVDEPFVRPIEAALGPYLEAVVLPKAEMVREAVAFLRKKKVGGRVRFVALDRLSSWPAPEDPPDAPGVRASDVVRAEGPVRRWVQLLLGRVIMVDSLEEALSLGPGWGGITKDGLWVRPDGEIWGGRTEEGGPGLLSRKLQMDRIRAQMSERRKELGEVEESIRKVVSERDKILSRISLLDTEIEELGRKLLSLDQERTQRAFEKRQLEERAGRLEEEERSLREALERLQVELVQDGLEKGKLERRRAEVGSLIREEEASVEKEEEARAGRLGALHGVQVELASVEERLEGARRELKRLEGMEKELSDARRRRAEEKAEAEARARAFVARRESAGRELEELTGKLKEMEEKYKILDQKRIALQGRLGTSEEEVRRTRAEYEEARSRAHEVEGRLSQLRMEAQEIWARVQEKYGVDVRELEPPDETFEPGLAEREVARLQERMEAMGPVNLGALEEYRREKERYEFLAKQQDDLLEARDTLKQTIVELNRKARKQFMDAFERVRGHFRESFVRFFGGGEADLVLSEGDDPLEAHISIVARPKGKKLQNISLLSGGEKALAAVALLFALYREKPGPFCILDEVDAMLDDANVQRFVEVLKQFSSETQFLVITHNKRTMEAADALYGVTMEEPGVSQLVAVRFEGGEVRAELNTPVE